MSKGTATCSKIPMNVMKLFFVGGIYRRWQNKDTKPWLTICFVVKILLIFLSFLFCSGGPLPLGIPSAFAAISAEGLSTPPCLAAGLFQPLQCGETLIRLSGHRPARSGRACCPKISRPPSSSSHFLTFNSSYPLSWQPLLAAVCLSVGKEICMYGHICMRDVDFEVQLQTPRVFLYANSVIIISILRHCTHAA